MARGGFRTEFARNVGRVLPRLWPSERDGEEETNSPRNGIFQPSALGALLRLPGLTGGRHQNGGTWNEGTRGGGGKY